MKKKLLAMLLVVGMALGMTACANSADDASAEAEGETEEAGDTAEAGDAEANTGDTIRIALCAPLTGDTSEQGNNQLNGAQMAVDEINEAGGIDGRMLEIVPFDDQAQPNQAVIVAEKIAADDTIQAVIAHINSGCTIAAQPTYIDAGLAVIGPVNAMDELSDEPWTNYFRMCLSDGASGKMLINVVKDETDFQKPGIFYENTSSSLSCAEIYRSYLEEAYGFTDIPMETFNPETDKDFSSQVEKFKNAGVDAIFMACEYTPSALIATQCHEKGYYPAFGGNAANNPAIFELGGEDVEGMYTMCGFFAGDPDPEIQRIVEKYQEEYGKETNDTVTRGYDAIQILADAFRNGATKETLADYLANETDVTSLGARYVWNGSIDNQEAYTYILKIENGEYVMCRKGTLADVQ